MTAAIGMVAFLGGAGEPGHELGAGRPGSSGSEQRLGVSEAMLGLSAALAADAPEISAGHQRARTDDEQQIGAGVVLRVECFNLAALLGLGAMVAGSIGLHRRWCCSERYRRAWCGAYSLLVVLGVVPPAVALCVLRAALVRLCGLGWAAGGGRRGCGFPGVGHLAAVRGGRGGNRAGSAIRPVPGRRPDVLGGRRALVAVVAASVTMERAASALGSRFAVPEIVVGGLVLAAVTSLPNAVAAVYLAARGRGAATLSTALNSNTLNVVAGLLIPAALTGLGRSSGQTVLAAVWYVGLTAVMLAFAYRDRGIRRVTGVLVIMAYFVFAGSVLGLGYDGPDAMGVAITAGLAVAAVVAARLATGRRPDAGSTGRARPPAAPVRPAALARPRRSGHGRSRGCRPDGSGPETARVPVTAPPGLRTRSCHCWQDAGNKELWLLGLAISFVVAAVDAALGDRVILIGLLIAGPCCVVLTGRWVPTALTSLLVTGLAVILGLPDGIWGSAVFFTWLGAVATVALVSTLAAAFIQTARPARPR